MFYEPSLPTISHKLYSVLFNFQIIIKIFLSPFATIFILFLLQWVFSLQSIDSCRLSGLHIFYIYPIIPYITSFICIPYFLSFLFLFFLLQWFFSAVHWQSHLQENDSCRLSGLLAVVIEKQVLQRQRENKIFNEKKQRSRKLVTCSY